MQSLNELQQVQQATEHQPYANRRTASPHRLVDRHQTSPILLAEASHTSCRKYVIIQDNLRSEPRIALLEKSQIEQEMKMGLENFFSVYKYVQSGFVIVSIQMSLLCPCYMEANFMFFITFLQMA